MESGGPNPDPELHVNGFGASANVDAKLKSARFRCWVRVYWNPSTKGNEANQWKALYCIE